MYIDETYYLNFPFKIVAAPIDKIHHIIKEKTALGRIKDPTIIYIGHGDSLNLTDLLNHPKIKKLKGSTIQVFLFEWFRYYVKGEPDKLTETKIAFSRNEYSQLRSEILDKLEQFTLETKISIVVNCCEANISKYFSSHYPSLTLQCLDLQNQIETLVLNYTEMLPKKNKLNFKFWCGTNRFAIHRHLVSCYLADKNGKYSWAFKINDFKNETEWLNKLPWNYLKKGNDILNEKQFYIDQKVDPVNIDNYYASYDANYLMKNFSGGIDFHKTFTDCFLCVVLESAFFQPTATVTEKTFNSMFTLTPFITVGAPHTLKYLRDLGFKTFDHWWDESYDQEEDHQERLLKIFNLIDFINNKSINELTEIYHNMLPTLIHNRDHVLNFHKKDIILP
jgi:hypothetical protein